ncbi:hypothetical protein JCM1840_006161 [Sporobolomyces johnsonii]
MAVNSMRVNADPTQLTAQLRAQLRDYISHTGAINSTLKDINQIQTELDVDQKPINLVKGRLDKTYDVLGEQATEEIRRLDMAIETLDALMALQSAAAADAVGAANKRSGQNPKKRKADGSSAAGSPAPSAAPSPLPTYSSRAGSPATTAPPLARSSSAKPPPPILPSQPIPIAAQPTPIAPALPLASQQPKKPTAKGRKEALQSQLPLKPGRSIVVRQSKKNVPGDNTAGDWILGRIITCIQGDKNRYAVEDVDYDPANPTPEGGKWNTTLKSIIPLPDKTDEKTYPEHAYPPGTPVLALYPETTSFYRAFVEAGPVAIMTGSGKNKLRERVYKLKFDDDGDVVRDVPVELVVESP